MQIDQTQYDAISHRAVRVIGPEVVEAMSSAQLGLFNRALGRVLLRHQGNAESVTDLEILGQWEQIMHHVLPTGSHEHLLP
ncbi:hypothetical protein [Aestuariivirga sp.]|uniref:hypothetical protein n=1 Tax=Aestuariivirga sp. TaxID=2650926 RepID=UPI003019C066